MNVLSGILFRLASSIAKTGRGERRPYEFKGNGKRRAENRAGLKARPYECKTNGKTGRYFAAVYFRSRNGICEMSTGS